MSRLQFLIFVRIHERPSPAPAKSADGNSTAARRNFERVIGRRVKNRFDLILRYGRDGFARAIGIFKLLTVQKIRRNCDDTIFGQLIAQAAQPISEAKNLLNDENGGRFVFALWINDERLDGALAGFDIDPFAMARRTVQSVLAKIFVLLCRRALREPNQAK